MMLECPSRTQGSDHPAELNLFNLAWQGRYWTRDKHYESTGNNLLSQLSFMGGVFRGITHEFRSQVAGF
ncbi:hypothetical protein I7I53_04538 [Histoplasma capsulatum var. duboisii H88]|uniref:Uncharacterized protein n=1 Tax=Ajellomyces capsulatus (strain H88) TaxID=544711 RepID=A0A8A1LSR1_AJEC8|nr:hypothetical protein I7I53_04538 [Histoplasma capsulatum var. duboisii H88]